MLPCSIVLTAFQIYTDAMELKTVADYLARSLSMIGNILHMDGGQAIVLSNNSLVDRMYDITNVNRDIDDAWVQEMKKEIKYMRERGQRMTATVGIDMRDIKNIIEVNSGASTEDEKTALDTFRVKVYDSQHRLKALSELFREDPKTLYDFYVVVYIVDTNEDEKALLEKLNKRREFTKKDRTVVDARKAFMDVWDEVTGHENQTRLCVRTVRTSKRIRNQEITNALSKMARKDMKEKLYAIAKLYHKEFLQECENSKFVNSAVYKVIAETKLYQLVMYYKKKDDSWLEQIHTK